MKNKHIIILVIIIASLYFIGTAYSNQTDTDAEKERKLSNDSSDFVVVSDVVPDVILEIRYYSNYNFVGERIDGYEQPTALLTKEAAAALKEVSDELAKKRI